MPEKIGDRVSKLEYQAETREEKLDELEASIERAKQKIEAVLEKIKDFPCRIHEHRLSNFDTLEINHEKRLKIIEDFISRVGGRRNVVIGLLVFLSNLTTGLVVALVSWYLTKN